MAEFYRKKKKICQMCAGKSVDYKDVDTIKISTTMPNKARATSKITGAKYYQEELLVHVLNTKDTLLVK